MSSLQAREEKAKKLKKKNPVKAVFGESFLWSSPLLRKRPIPGLL
jgi:hypothetical protein